MFHQPRSLEGATGGSWRWSGVRRLRLRALQARGPGGYGARLEALRPPATVSLSNDGGRYSGNAGADAVNERATRPTNAVRSAERRCVPFAKGMRTPQGVH